MNEQPLSQDDVRRGLGMLPIDNPKFSYGKMYDNVIYFVKLILDYSVALATFFRRRG